MLDRLGSGEGGSAPVRRRGSSDAAHNAAAAHEVRGNRERPASAPRRCALTRGSILLESVLYLPLFFLLLVGMIELARVSYTYYSIHKILYTIARYAGTRQGVNFCDTADATLTAVKNLALTGDAGDAGTPYINGLEADMIQVRIERRNSETGELEACECAVPGCDAAAGGIAPEFIVVSIPDGYPVQLRFPSLTLDPIPLRFQIRVPFGGT